MQSDLADERVFFSQLGVEVQLFNALLLISSLANYWNTVLSPFMRNLSGSDVFVPSDEAREAQHRLDTFELESSQYSSKIQKLEGDLKLKDRQYKLMSQRCAENQELGLDIEDPAELSELGREIEKDQRILADFQSHQKQENIAKQKEYESLQNLMRSIQPVDKQQHDDEMSALLLQHQDLFADLGGAISSYFQGIGRILDSEVGQQAPDELSDVILHLRQLLASRLHFARTEGSLDERHAAVQNLIVLIGKLQKSFQGSVDCSKTLQTKIKNGFKVSAAPLRHNMNRVHELLGVALALASQYGDRMLVEWKYLCTCRDECSELQGEELHILARSLEDSLSRISDADRDSAKVVRSLLSSALKVPPGKHYGVTLDRQLAEIKTCAWKLAILIAKQDNLPEGSGALGTLTLLAKVPVGVVTNDWPERFHGLDAEGIIEET
jgi:hypothetical protein